MKEKDAKALLNQFLAQQHIGSTQAFKATYEKLMKELTKCERCQTKIDAKDAHNYGGY